MKSPTKEQIEEAIVWITSTYDNSPPNTIVNAYRAALARAELAERHAERWRSFAFGCLDESSEYEEYRKIAATHERERKELEA